MKEGWEYKKLKEVGLTQTGTTPSKQIKSFYGGDIPFIRPAELNIDQNGGILYESELKLTEEGALKARVIKENSVLMCCIGSVGKTGFTLRSVTCNQQINTITPYDNYNPKFVYYALISPSFQQEVTKIANSAKATLPIISKGKWEVLSIPIPPLSEQQSIVNYLDSAFAKIDAMKANAEKSLNEAKALFQASLKEMLEPKEGWEEKTINDVAVFRNGVAHEKDIEEGGGYIVINSKFVATEGSIKKYTNKQLSPLYTNEIVMVMSDVPKGKTLAKCYIIECDDKYSLNQRICAFKSKGLDMKFLYYILNRNPHLLKYDNGENQTNLRKKQIIECPVAYPPQKKEQQSIVDYLDSLKSKVDRLQANFEKISQECDALKQALLREVFEG